MTIHDDLTLITKQTVCSCDALDGGFFYHLVGIVIVKVKY